MVRVYGIFDVVGPNAENRGGDDLRYGCAAYIHEGGGEEGRDQDTMPILVAGCIEGVSKGIYADGVGDGCEVSP